MKKLLVILFSLSVYSAFCQLDQWYGSVLKYTMQFDHVKMNNAMGTMVARYAGHLGSDVSAKARVYGVDYYSNPGSYTQNFANANVELIGKHAYFDFVNIAAYFKDIAKPIRNNIKGPVGGRGYMADYMGFKLALGGRFSENVGLYIGAQWSWTELMTGNTINSGESFAQSGDTIVQTSYFGFGQRANYRGPGVHLFISAGDKSLIRCSGYYDFIKKKSGQNNSPDGNMTRFTDFTGHRIGGEICYFYRIGEKVSLMAVGGWYQAVFDARVTPSLKTGNTDNLAGYSPKIVANDFKFQIGIALHRFN